MNKRAPHLEEIGFEWRPRKYDNVSWDDRLEQLVSLVVETKLCKQLN